MKSLFFYVTLFSLFGLVIGNQLKTTPCDLCIDIVNISARYRTPELLLQQARKTFTNVDVAEDFMEIQLPLLRVKQRVPEA